MLSKCVVILLLVAFEAQSICGQTFRKGYTYLNKEKSFYKISSEAKTWEQAQLTCSREGASLFFPGRKTEAKSILALLNENRLNMDDIFLGICNRNPQGIYKAMDGRRISNVYNNWAIGQPSRMYRNESCVVMDIDGLYSVESCNSLHYFICEKTLSSLEWNEECNLPDPGYKYNKELDRCYKFHLDPQNWDDAYLTCAAEESYLAIINSSQEDKYLINITATAPKDNIEGDYLRGAAHLGFHNKTGIWLTIKGGLLEDTGFVEGWADSQPDGNGTEICGSMFYTGELNDIGCWQRMFFICEHEINRRWK